MGRLLIHNMAVCSVSDFLIEAYAYDSYDYQLVRSGRGEAIQSHLFVPASMSLCVAYSVFFEPSSYNASSVVRIVANFMFMNILYPM